MPGLGVFEEFIIVDKPMTATEVMIRNTEAYKRSRMRHNYAMSKDEAEAFGEFNKKLDKLLKEKNERLRRL